MFGREVELTRDQFIDRWENKTEGFYGLFLEQGNTEHLRDFINEVKILAGLQWDNSK
jgi:hypothetical protein